MARKPPPTGPERYYGVSHSQLSIARHYGGLTVNGVFYVYDPTKDELIRQDVLKREKKEGKHDGA